MKKSTHFLCAFLSMAAPSMAATVIEWNFDGLTTESWTAANTTGLTVASGLLSGKASNNDPALNLVGQTISLVGDQTWEKVEFRVRETSFAPFGTIDFADGATVNVFNAVGLTLQFNGSGTGIVTVPTSTAIDGDGFFTVTYNISGVAANTSITSLRVDPIGGAGANSNSETNGNTFDVDFIRITAVPEPSAALLFGIGVIGLLRRRR